tara:strand:- start:917 stop:1030 length:114 start_codon:yes stop_codon:yes gene_type:complete
MILFLQFVLLYAGMFLLVVLLSELLTFLNKKTNGWFY